MNVIEAARMAGRSNDVGGLCFGVERVALGVEGGLMVGRVVGASPRVEDIRSTFEVLSSRCVRFTEPLSLQPWGGSFAHFEDPDSDVLALPG